MYSLGRANFPIRFRHYIIYIPKKIYSLADETIHFELISYMQRAIVTMRFVSEFVYGHGNGGVFMPSKYDIDKFLFISPVEKIFRFACCEYIEVALPWYK